MAATGVYLIRPSHNGTPNRKDIKTLKKILLEEGYKIERLSLFNSFDIFLKLAIGRRGDSFSCYLDGEALEKLEQIGYSDDTRHYGVGFGF